MTDEYRVQLDVFSGPLDLLLYLIRRDEIDVQDISISRLTEQYVAYAHLLEQLDPNSAGEFLVMAATLAELKSRALLPSPPIEPLDDEDDPRAQLVRQLLEYKRFKDAARALADRADRRRQRFVRAPTEMPPELRGVELEEVEVWDLLEAFGRVMTAIGRGPGVHEVNVDDRPIEEYAASIAERLRASGPIPFHALFGGVRRRGTIVCLFLALLELVRSRSVSAEQEQLHGVIYLFPMVEASAEDAREPAEPGAEPPTVGASQAAAGGGDSAGDECGAIDSFAARGQSEAPPSADATERRSNEP